MQNLLRERVKLYLVTEDNWFIKADDNMEDIEKVCQIEDASSYYAEYDAVKLFEKCEQLGIACKIIKYIITYKPEQEIKVAQKEKTDENGMIRKCKLCGKDTGDKRIGVCNKCASEYKF